jgi:AraC-like DNA-binding protein
MSKLARYSRFATDDVDEARDFLKRCRYELCDARRYQLTIHTAALELLSVTTFEARGEIHSRSHSDPAAYVLVRMDAGTWDSSSNKRRVLVTPGQGVLQPPDCDNASRMTGALVTSIHIPARLVRQEAEFLTGGQIDGPLELAGPVDLSAGSVMGSLISFFLDELERAGGVFNKYPSVGLDLQRRLIQLLIQRTRNNYSALLGRRFGGPAARRHVTAMKEYIDAHLYDSITLGDLAHAAGVDERTLRYACQSSRNQSPMMILRAMRLQVARDRIKSPMPNDTVASIAHELRYDPRRFMEYYSRQFQGESASEMLQKGLRRK